MALRRRLTKHLFPNQIEATALGAKPSPLQRTLVPQNAANTDFRRQLINSSESSGDTGFFRRFLQFRGINQASSRIPEFLMFPAGDKLRERLNLASRDRLRFDGLNPPAQYPAPAPAVPLDGISVHDARKILRSSQLEKLRSTLAQIPMNSIPYNQFVEICSDVCSNREQGVEFGRMLDEAGNVIVLGNVVFLRPEQVAKSMEKLIAESMAVPDDPRNKQLLEMEEQKAIIDKKAESLARVELFCGLGFLVVQTLGCMRLTFWELSWDVMEPICFFLASFDFALAYAFFLRTSKEPTFEGFFQHRFKVKQKKLMKTHNFDIEKYNHLCKAFYHNYNNNNLASSTYLGASASAQAHA